MLNFRKTLVALAASSLLLVPGCGSKAEVSADSGADKPTLVFTAIPDQNSTELQQKFDPVAKYLSTKLKVPVKYLATSSYDASVESFKNGDVQLAWFGGLTGVQARQDVAGSMAIAQGSIDPHFKSYFVAHVDTGIQPGDDFPMGIKGKSFTFGSRRSTSGRLMPEHFIRQNTGQSPDDFFGQLSNFSGSHDKTAKLVEAGTFEVGALNYATYDQMVADGKLDPAKCVKIWTTPDYADYNWTAHPDLETTYGAGFTKKLQQALIDMKDPELLAAVTRPDGLISATNDDFASIHTLAVELGFLE
ncbi:MAG: putative selenate ABC transporter substrate-binding protein [Planctomycetes bacterium]|nr:putative selenate ABC transporter substrate-binding protein [Planctomycetota bacterium]